MPGSEGAKDVEGNAEVQTGWEAERMRKGKESVASRSHQEMEVESVPKGRVPIFSKTIVFSSGNVTALGRVDDRALG